jgi:hypothetical protein
MGRLQPLRQSVGQGALTVPLDLYGRRHRDRLRDSSDVI